MAKRILTGKIVSDKMQKTVVVTVDTQKRHKFYGKLVTSTKRYKARNEIEAKLGDIIEMEESRPFSKEVKWIVKKVIVEAK